VFSFSRERRRLADTRQELGRPRLGTAFIHPDDLRLVGIDYIVVAAIGVSFLADRDLKKRQLKIFSCAGVAFVDQLVVPTALAVAAARHPGGRSRCGQISPLSCPTANS
jgi:hypothetical protein